MTMTEFQFDWVRQCNNSAIPRERVLWVLLHPWAGSTFDPDWFSDLARSN